jgi:DNA helicase II / ATP-dependent DNA helicase PcrA
VIEAPLQPLLDDLNEAQRAAVLATSGPVAILAGAGTGKTRVISRRAAYAIATGVVPAGEVLIVTFTEKAAREMADRLDRLGCREVTARTFHAHALSQLRYFWPGRHDGTPLPAVLESKYPIVGRIARALPGGYRFTPAKDLADEIEWAKNRRLGPPDYAAAALDVGREPPIPIELMVRAFADYERAKTRAGRIDFEDMLGATIELFETDPAAVAVARSRKRWFSVDEYQDTNPLQERLLGLWAGGSRDVCVVGDEDQTIYGFTGASSEYLRAFARTHPGTTVVELTDNYRSSPEVLDLANRLLASTGRTKRLTATRPSGPRPSAAAFTNAESELQGLASGIRTRILEGIAAVEISVLVRMNAQLPPIEAALTTAGIPYSVRGGRFYERTDVKAAIRAIDRAHLAATGRDLPDAIREVFASALGFDPEAAPGGPEERERAADLGVLIAIAEEYAASGVGAGAETDATGLLAELARRDAAERGAAGGGVTLSTIHRAKGLEWDAVFLPGLEEGTLPIGQAAGDVEAIDEERRLLYVAITRARIHLSLSWAERRNGPGGRESSRRPSRFLGDLGLLGAGHAGRGRGTGGRTVGDRAGAAAAASSVGAGSAPPTSGPRFEALRAWRSERAKGDGVPAYVVAHDTTLAEIADARPTSLAALRRVKGMGPARLERYGAEILAVIAPD